MHRHTARGAAKGILLGPPARGPLETGAAAEHSQLSYLEGRRFPDLGALRMALLDSRLRAWRAVTVTGTSPPPTALDPKLGGAQL